MELDFNEILDNVSSAHGPDGALDRIANSLEKLATLLEQVVAPESSRFYPHIRTRNLPDDN